MHFSERMNSSCNNSIRYFFFLPNWLHSGWKCKRERASILAPLINPKSINNYCGKINLKKLSPGSPSFFVYFSLLVIVSWLVFSFPLTTRNSIFSIWFLILMAVPRDMTMNKTNGDSQSSRTFLKNKSQKKNQTMMSFYSCRKKMNVWGEYIHHQEKICTTWQLKHYMTHMYKKF